MAEYTGPKAKVNLEGGDGNAFMVMGKVTLAMRRQGIGKEVIDEYRERAMSGNYDNLLRVSMEYTEPTDED